MESKIIKALYIGLVYLICWHISFVLMFLSRGDKMDFILYKEYVHFILVPGLVIPSYIQLFAIILTSIYFVIISNRNKKK